LFKFKEIEVCPASVLGVEVLLAAILEAETFVDFVGGCVRGKSIEILTSFPFHRHLLIFCHLLREGILSVFADITDAGGSVAIKQESKDLADKVVVNLTFCHILVALGTSMQALLLTALANLAPRCFLVLLASRAFAIEELFACSAI
jgi:hypothetical protein